MSTVSSRFRRSYGAGPFHLVAVLLAVVVGGSTLLQLGPTRLVSGDSWWQTIGVWFVGAVVLHDLVLFPAYSATDRLVALLARRRRAGAAGAAGAADAGGSRPDVALVNHVRVPLAATALTFLVFFPGILEQGSNAFRSATGQDQDPYLLRWVLLSAAIWLLSGLVWAVRRLRTSDR